MVNLNQFFITLPKVFFRTIFKNYYLVCLVYLVPYVIMSYGFSDLSPTNYDAMYPGYTGQSLYLAILGNTILITVLAAAAEELVFRFWNFADTRSFLVRVLFVSALLYTYNAHYLDIKWATGLEDLPQLRLDYDGTILGFIVPINDYLETTVVANFLVVSIFYQIINSIIFVFCVEILTRVLSHITKRKLDPWKMLGLNHKYFGYVWAIFSLFLFTLSHYLFIEYFEKNMIYGLMFFLSMINLYIIYYFYGFKRATIFHIFWNYALSYFWIDKLSNFDQFSYFVLYSIIFVLLAYINIRFALENKIIDRFPKTLQT